MNPTKRRRSTRRKTDQRISFSTDPSSIFALHSGDALRPDMSLEAKGLYMVLSALEAAKTPVWRSDLQNLCNSSIYRVRKTLTELVKLGYISRTFDRDPNGHIVGSRLIFHSANYKDRTDIPKYGISVLPLPTPQHQKHEPVPTPSGTDMAPVESLPDNTPMHGPDTLHKARNLHYLSTITDPANSWATAAELARTKETLQ